MQVCGTTPCRLNGAQKVTEALTEYLGIGMGQTTEDGTFTLGEMECMGACVNAPMIVVSDYSNGVEGFSYIYYEDLTPEDAVNVAKAYAAGGPPTPSLPLPRAVMLRAVLHVPGALVPGAGCCAACQVCEAGLAARVTRPPGLPASCLWWRVSRGWQPLVPG